MTPATSRKWDFKTMNGTTMPHRIKIHLGCHHRQTMMVPSGAIIRISITNIRKLSLSIVIPHCLNCPLSHLLLLLGPPPHRQSDIVRIRVSTFIRECLPQNNSQSRIEMKRIEWHHGLGIGWMMSRVFGGGGILRFYVCDARSLLSPEVIGHEDRKNMSLWNYYYLYHWLIAIFVTFSLSGWWILFLSIQGGDFDKEITQTVRVGDSQ